MNIQMMQTTDKTMGSREEKPMVFPDIRTAVIYMMHRYVSNLPYSIAPPVRNDAVFSVIHANGSYRAELLINGGIVEFDERDDSDMQIVSESEVAEFYANVYVEVSEFKDKQKADEFNEFIKKVKNEIQSNKGVKKDRSKTYFILNTETKLIKIGKSIRPDQRLRDIQGMAGAKLKMLAVIDKNIESELHIHFKKYRRTGEWFDDNEGAISEFIEKLTRELEAA